MNFSQFFVRRPVFAMVLSLLIVIGGVISLFQLPVSEYPEVAPPTIVIRASFPGAAPTTVSETVASPLEQAMTGLENMLYMSSQSSSDGNLTLTLTFALDTNLDNALSLVQSRVNRSLSSLPIEVQRLGVTVDKTSPSLALVVHLISPGQEYDRLYLANYMDVNVINELYKIDGVSDIRLLGMGDYSLRVWLDPDKIAARNLTASEVVSAIRSQNRQVAAGTLGSPPGEGEHSFQLLINAQGRLTSEEEFENIVIRAGAGAEITRLRDVGRIELGSSQYALRAHLDNQPSAALQIFQSPGANTIALASNVRQRMQELAADFPPGIQHSIGYDPTVFVRHSISAVVTTLFEAVALVVLVVIVFLQTWRASIIPLAAVPVSLIGTLAVMHLLGFSLNTLSLFGLVLAIGIVVDDAIVVVENVERNITLGFDPTTATERAMYEATTPIIATALVLSAVFIPTAFIPGLTGQFYQQFALTITISTIISAFNSLTLSPALSAILLQPRGAPKDRFSLLLDRCLGRWLLQPFNRLFERAGHAYSGVTHRILRRSGISLAVYAGLLVLTWVGFKNTPVGFVPDQDKQYLVAFAQLPEGASLDRTERVIERMATIALEHPGVAHTVSFSGLSINGFVNSSNSGLMFIPLKSFEERTGQGLSANEIVQSLNTSYADIEEAFMLAVLPAPVDGLGSVGGFRLQIEDRGNLGHEELFRQTQNIIAKARQVPELAGVYSSYQISAPQIDAHIDRDKALAHGVAADDVFDTLQIYLGSLYVNDFNRFGRTYQVNAQAEQRFRLEPEQIGQMRVRNDHGEMVPLSSFITVTEASGPDRVMRYNGHVTAELNGVPASGYSSGQAQTAMQELLARELPNGMTYEWTELAYQQQIAGQNGFLVFSLCVLLAFLVLAALYESWSLPLAVILTVPMTLLSALVGVIVTNGDNNMFTQIGLIVLIGLACKNAILIVEFAKERQEEGMDPVSAILEACQLRLRPVLMTSAAFIMGVVPLALSTGAGAEMRRSMGIAVLSGMVGVTLFGLLLTPLFYAVIRRQVEKRREQRASLSHSTAQSKAIRGTKEAQT